MNNIPSQFSKNLCLGIIAWAFCFCGFARQAPNTPLWDQLIGVEKNESLSIHQKLQQVLLLKKQSEDQKLTRDSVYARMLHRISLYEYLLNNEVATTNAILFTHAAARINSSGQKGSNPAFCVNSFSNLAIYYKSLRQYPVAAQYYDSALTYQRQYMVPEISGITLLLDKARMLHEKGDYQKAVEEINVAVLKAKEGNDSLLLHDLLNQRAQSYLMEGRLDDALSDVNRAANYSQQPESNESTNSMIIKARILAKKKEFSQALPLFHIAIKQRLQTNDFYRLANDHTDLGNFYLNELRQYDKAREAYLKAADYALKVQDPELMSKAHINLQLCSSKQNRYKEAEKYCMAALSDLNISTGNTIFFHPSAGELSSVGNKELLYVILGNKTELLLHQYVRTGDKNYLSACLRTALLTDTLLTKIRQEQWGEQSKLHWRNWTREFFTHALDACYLAGNDPLAFYFMEKSRAVLLSDRLNELGASAHLPPAEAGTERGFQVAVLSEQQKLASIKSNEAGYEAQLARLSQAKSALEHYLGSLGKKYPAYYQYKYADKVPSLDDLQKQLMANRQSFVHYFINDTVAYMLGIVPSGTKLLKLSKDVFADALLNKFLQACSSEPALNSQYASFASLSHSLYQLLFQPLELPEGRVVICPDNIMIPFEALCTDRSGNDFLMEKYVFSYVYSARYLLEKNNNYQAKGDFIGFAPVSFASYYGIADLKGSDGALKKSARHYNQSKLLLKDRATRHHFMETVSGYTIANVFSHARADTTGNEPVLFMHDSVIYLSELQLLRQPATKLAVLSACQTSVGRSAIGEGIFSLARGFATAGIPSVAATLWQADEQAIYEISEIFHDHLSKGLPKDKALQLAKLSFIRNSEITRQHPYYWANMILVGNAEPVRFSGEHYRWWWAPIVIFIAAVILLKVFFTRKRFA